MFPSLTAGTRYAPNAVIARGPIQAGAARRFEAAAVNPPTWLTESGKINNVTTPRIWVDYTIYGRSRLVTARLRKTDREQLSVGQEVIVEGDTVDDARAVITAIDGPDVQLRLLDEDAGL